MVKINFGFGTGKVSNSDSALVRPFRLLIDEGKPIGTINYLFYRSNKSYVLGVLCYTPGRRLLFFPGSTVRTPRWYTKGQLDLTKVEQDNPIDHLTLESDLCSYHATLINSNLKRKVLTSYRTKKVSDNLTYWFGLSLESEKILEECPEENDFQFSSPPQDSQRRVKIVMESRKGAKFHIIELNPNAEPVSGSFLHFDFLVEHHGGHTMRGFFRRFPRWRSTQDILFAPTTAPTYPPSLKKTISIPNRVHARRHPVTIPEFSGIVWVVSSVRIGELNGQALIGGF
jgi:hypothetical protein